MFSPGRYEVLEYALAGFKKSGLLLVEFDGTNFAPLFTPRPIGSVDDIGLFIIIPQIAQWLDIPLNKAIEIFFNGCAFLAVMCGLIGVVLLYWQSWKQLLLGSLSILGASVFALSMTRDVQLMYSFTIIGSLPPLLFFMKNFVKFERLSIIFFITGFLYGCINYIRLHAALGMTLWLLSSLWLLPRNKKTIIGKCALSIVFFIGMFLPTIYVNRIQRVSDQFLKEHEVNYQPTAHVHPTWHTIYAGFGFSNFLNRKDLRIADDLCLEIATQKHKGEIDFSHPLYDLYLKGAVIELCSQEPFFILATLATKFGILLYYLFRYSNIALLALFFQFSWVTLMPFFIGLIFNAIVPLLYVPCGSYALGFITFLQISSMAIVNGFLSNQQTSKKIRRIVFLLIILMIIINTGGSLWQKKNLKNYYMAGLVSISYALADNSKTVIPNPDSLKRIHTISQAGALELTANFPAYEDSLPYGVQPNSLNVSDLLTLNRYINWHNLSNYQIKSNKSLYIAEAKNSFIVSALPQIGTVFNDKEQYLFDIMVKPGTAIFAPVSAEIEKLKVSKYSKLATVQGPTAFYHWLIDRLPSVFLLRDLILKDPEIKLLVNSESPPRYVLEYLDLLGISPDKLVIAEKDTLYQADTVYFGTPFLMEPIPQKLLLEMRGSLIQEARNRATTKHKNNLIVIIQRREPDRRIENLDELTKIAESIFLDCEVVIFDGSGSLSEQILMFENAKIVIGVMASGLANVIYTNPGTSIIEIHPKTHHLDGAEWCWWLASAVDADYWVVPHEFAFSDNSVTCPLDDIINVFKKIITKQEKKSISSH